MRISLYRCFISERTDNNSPVDLKQPIVRNGRQATVGYVPDVGNPNQWGPNHWPPEDLIHDDISRKRLFVCDEDGHVIGVFYYDYGADIDASFRTIESGAWKNNEPYGIVHRIASDGSRKNKER